MSKQTTLSISAKSTNWLLKQSIALSPYYSSFNSSLVKVISEALLALIEESKRLCAHKDSLRELKASAFYHAQPPSISIHNYLLRIIENTQMGESTLIIALIYLDRLFREHHVAVNEFTIHRLVITCMLIAIKYNEDLVYKASFYAKVAGVTKKDLLLLETEMLKMIDYNLYVDNEEFDVYKSYFEAFLPQVKERSLLFSKQLLCL